MLHPIFARRAAALVILIAFTLAGTACDDPDAGGGSSEGSNSPHAAAGAAAGARSASPTTAELSARDEPQTVRHHDGLRVTVPGGALTEPARMHIALVADAPAPGFACYRALATYDLRIGDQERFDADLVIERPIAPGELREDLPADAQFAAAYLDPEERQWIELPCEVDAAAGLLRIRTRHLCYLQIWYLGVGYTLLGCGPGNDMGLLYNLEEVRKNTRKYRAVHSSDDPRIPPFVSDVREFAIQALKKYRGAGFDLYTRPLRIMVTGSGDSAHSTLSRRVFITFEEGKASILRYVVAHEIFHNIQMNEYSIPGVVMRRWWTEVTAEYAASRVALENYVHMGKRNMGPFPARFLGIPLMHAPTPRPGWWKWMAGADPHPFHAYQSVYLLEQIVRSGVAALRAVDPKSSAPAYFHRLYKAVAGGGVMTLPSLDAFLTDLHGPEQGLRRQFERYAMWYLLDPRSPAPQSSQGRTRIDEKELEGFPVMTADLRELPPHTFQLAAGYTAAAWMTRVEVEGGAAAAERSLVVSPGGELPGDTSVLVCKLPGRLRAAGIVPAGVIRAPADATRQVTVSLGPDDGLCVVAVNASTASKSVTIEVSEAEFAIAAIVPPVAAPGEPITIRGRGFGATPPVRFGEGLFFGEDWVRCEPGEWSEKEIRTRVPYRLASAFQLRFGARRSNAFPFAVKVAAYPPGRYELRHGPVRVRNHRVQLPSPLFMDVDSSGAVQLVDGRRDLRVGQGTIRPGDGSRPGAGLYLWDLAFESSYEDHPLVDGRRCQYSVTGRLSSPDQMMGTVRGGALASGYIPSGRRALELGGAPVPPATPAAIEMPNSDRSGDVANLIRQVYGLEISRCDVEAELASQQRRRQALAAQLESVQALSPFPPEPGTDPDVLRAVVRQLSATSAGITAGFAASLVERDQLENQLRDAQRVAAYPPQLPYDRLGADLEAMVEGLQAQLRELREKSQEGRAELDRRRKELDAAGLPAVPGGPGELQTLSAQAANLRAEIALHTARRAVLVDACDELRATLEATSAPRKPPTDPGEALRFQVWVQPTRVESR